MSGIGTVELVFLLLLLFIVVFGLLARKLGTPYPIVMVIGGLLLGFVPGIPGITLNPDLIFLVVLPPLLYAAAWTTSWRDFRYNLVSIFLLAFGLVGFTVLAVALVAPRIFSGFDWRLGLVLGAVVAPTDAIAATSIARRVGLPGRIVDILEGESLINDATGLLALQFATAIVVEKRVPTVSSGVAHARMAGRRRRRTRIARRLDCRFDRAADRRRPDRDHPQHSGSLCGLSGRGRGSRFGRTGCCRLRIISHPAQRPLLLAIGSHSDLVRLAIVDFRSERTGFRPHWTSTSRDSRLHPRIQPLDAAA